MCREQIMVENNIIAQRFYSLNNITMLSKKLDNFSSHLSLL